MEARSDVPQKLKFPRGPLPVDKANLLMEARNTSDGSQFHVASRVLDPSPAFGAQLAPAARIRFKHSLVWMSIGSNHQFISLRPYSGLVSYARSELDNVKRLEISEADKNGILGGNITRLLDMPR